MTNFNDIKLGILAIIILQFLTMIQIALTSYV